MKETMKKNIIAALLVFGAAVNLAAGENIPRPEYPRPQFERQNWVNLNGEWTYRFDLNHVGLEKGYSESKGFDGTILVPFSPESELSGVGYTDFITGIWYHRTLDVPAAWEGQRIFLNFGAVYYQSEVFIDGKFVGRHFGGSSSFSFDITDFAAPGTSHDLVVYAQSDLRSMNQPAGKQSLMLGSHDCEYIRTTGIWQTVWMESIAENGLKNVQVNTDIDQKQLVVRPAFYKEGAASLKITVTDPDSPKKPVAQKEVSATNSSVAVIPFKTLKTWSPENPFLYDVDYQVLDKNGKVIDEVKSYVGMRKVHTEGNKIFLNNVPYYQRLVLDQGYYPQSQWTAPSDEALKHDIELSKSAGFNGARLHQKVFEERFHYWADKLGYLTWAEFPSWGIELNGVEPARNFLSEWAECVVRDRNYPSIITWTPMNEEFWPDNVQYPRFSEDIYALTKQLDPTRPINICSGGIQVKTDIWTEHHYEQDPEKLKEIIWNDGKLFTRPVQTYKGRINNIGFNDPARYGGEPYTFYEYDGSIPYILDEFGGIKWVKGQDATTVNSTTQSWGYGKSVVSMEDFYKRLEAQVKAVVSMSKSICGFCYTQLTDVEQEQNGVYCYDRSEKFDMARIRAIFTMEPEGE